MFRWYLSLTIAVVNIWRRICLAADRTRRLTLWGLFDACGRRRDMLYLRNGSWIDFSPAFEPDQVLLWYNSERHRVLGATESLEARSDRWSWLSAVERGGRQRDLTPWLEGLRVPRVAVSRSVLLALFAHQNGWMPRGVLTVILRDGSEEQIDADTGAEVVIGAREIDVNYIH